MRDRFPLRLTGPIDDLHDDFASDDDIDPDRLTSCAYWRCGQLFERRNANHIYCRKACRSRQHKWERAQERKAARAGIRAAERATTEARHQLA